MKNFTFFFLIYLFYILNCNAQACPKIFIESQYKKQYYPVGNNLSQQLSLIGMYKESLIERDRFTISEGFQLIPGKEVKALNAYPFIYNAIKENDIVILNENHSSPLHRLLLYNIIDSFKQSGINSIFLETLGYTAVDSNSYAGKPNINWGIYSSENIYFQVLKKLMDNHINLYSYEKNFEGLDTITINNKKNIINKKDPSWIPTEIDSLILYQFYANDNAHRDVEQALKIYQKLKRNNIKKAFIYCGGTHEWKANGYMAGTLKHLLKKEIYVMDQLMLNEHSTPNKEDPLYINYCSPSFPITLVDQNNKLLHNVFVPPHDTSNFIIDMAILSPRTVYKNNRPTWLELNGRRRRYPLSGFIDVTKYTDDFLIVIYDEDDEKKKFEAIPTDVFQVQSDAATIDAILFPNRVYHLMGYRNGTVIIDQFINTGE